MNPAVRLAFPAALALLTAACGSVGSGDSVIQFPKGQPLVEVVNGQPVPMALLDALARGRRLDLTQPDQYQKALSELTEYVLLAQEAKREGFPSAPKYQAEIEINRLQGVASSTLNEMHDRADLDESILRKEYDNQIALAGNREYDISQLIFATEAEALKAADDLVSGQTFQQVFNKYNKSAKQARSFSHVRLDQLPPPLSSAVKALQTNQTTAVPVQTQYGWHIVHVDSISTFTPPTYASIKDRIRESLIAQLAKDRIAKLREDATITLVAAAPVAAKPAAVQKPADSGVAKPAEQPSIKPATAPDAKAAEPPGSPHANDKD